MYQIKDNSTQENINHEYIEVEKLKVGKAHPTKPNVYIEEVYDFLPPKNEYNYVNF
jgi:hypothetical protein